MRRPVEIAQQRAHFPAARQEFQAVRYVPHSPAHPLCVLTTSSSQRYNGQPKGLFPTGRIFLGTRAISTAPGFVRSIEAREASEPRGSELDQKLVKCCRGYTRLTYAAKGSHFVGSAMSLRAVGFVESWLSKNIQRHISATDCLIKTPNDYAVRLLIAANASGIPPEEIFNEFPDLVSAITAILAGAPLALGEQWTEAKEPRLT